MSNLVTTLRHVSRKGTKPVSLLIGQVVQRGVVRPETLKIRTTKMKLDDRINKFFNIRRDYWAEENGRDCLIGDIVMIKNQEGVSKVKVTHQVDSIIFKLGRVMDPLTGRQCRGMDFVDEADQGTDKTMDLEKTR